MIAIRLWCLLGQVAASGGGARRCSRGLANSTTATSLVLPATAAGTRIVATDLDPREGSIRDRLFGIGAARLSETVIDSLTSLPPAMAAVGRWRVHQAVHNEADEPSRNRGG